MAVRPSWVTAIGVLGIIFGCTAILGGGQQMMMPKILAFQKQMFADMSADMERARKNSNCHNDSAVPGSAADSSARSVGSGAVPAPRAPCQAGSLPFSSAGVPALFQDLWSFPPWFATWMVITGALRTVIGALYLFSAIWFIQMKPSSIWLFSVALSLSILLGVVQLAATFFAASFMVAAMMAGSSVGMIFDVVMLIVIWMSDRSAFRPAPVVLDDSAVTQ
jgi:hypothetical protein